VRVRSVGRASPGARWTTAFTFAILLWLGAGVCSMGYEWKEIMDEWKEIMDEWKEIMDVDDAFLV
jgi:hypothetical protein